jgi:hypothetical protein
MQISVKVGETNLWILMFKNNERKEVDHISQITFAFLCLFTHFYTTAYQLHRLELKWISALSVHAYLWDVIRFINIMFLDIIHRPVCISKHIA